MDITGKTFGQLTAIRRVTNPNPESKSTNSYYLFGCLCGREYVAKGSDVKRGLIKRCHLCKAEDACVDMVGKTFGDLTAIKRVPNPKAGKVKHNHAYYLFKCSCGVEYVADGTTVRKGLIKQCPECGLASRVKQYKQRNGDKSVQWRGHGDISGTFWSRIMYNSKKRGIPFDITIEYAWGLYVRQGGKCALSGVKIDFNGTDGCTASLDRADSLGSYSKDNVQWVHKHINTMKNVFTQSYFIGLCMSVSDSVLEHCGPTIDKNQLKLELTW